MKQVNINSISFKNGNIYLHDQMLCNPQNFESVDELINEVANLYIVSESGFGNHARLSLVWAFDEGEAVENALCTELENVCSIEQIELVK